MLNALARNTMHRREVSRMLSQGEESGLEARYRHQNSLKSSVYAVPCRICGPVCEVLRYGIVETRLGAGHLARQWRLEFCRVAIHGLTLFAITGIAAMIAGLSLRLQ